MSQKTLDKKFDSSLQIAICPKDDKNLEMMYKKQRKLLKPHVKISAAVPTATHDQTQEPYL